MVLLLTFNIRYCHNKGCVTLPLWNAIKSVTLFLFWHAAPRLLTAAHGEEESWKTIKTRFSGVINFRLRRNTARGTRELAVERLTWLGEIEGAEESQRGTVQDETEMEMEMVFQLWVMSVGPVCCLCPYPVSTHISFPVSTHISSLGRVKGREFVCLLFLSHWSSVMSHCRESIALP